MWSVNPHWIHPDPAWHGIALPSFRWRQVIVCHLFNGIYVHWMRTFIPWAAVLMSSLYQLAIWIKYSYSGFAFILKYQSLEPSNMWCFQFGRFAFCSIHSPQCFLSMCRNAKVVCQSSFQRLDATWDVGEYLHQLREIHSWSQLFWKVWARPNLRGATQRNKGLCNNEKPLDTDDKDWFHV